METGTDAKQVCRVLYIFSGRPRKNSVSSWLKKLSKHLGIAVEVEMVDIRVRPFLDLTDHGTQQRLLNKIAAGRYFAVLISPPCSTFSRVTWANRKGPRPVRSFTHPRGMARLTWSERKRADWGNTMADFAFEAFTTQMAHGGHMALFENPEDLGAVKSGEHAGKRPASMWQWEQFFKLLENPDIKTAAFYQEDFGTDYLKPTRLLLGGFNEVPESFSLEQPSFDDQGFYTGPLLPRAAKRQLVGWASTGFATTGTEQWPSLMCR